MYKKSLKINAGLKLIMSSVLMVLAILSLTSIKMLNYKLRLLTYAYKSSSLSGNLIARNLPDMACIILLILSLVAFRVYLFNKKRYFFTVSLLVFLCACMNIAEDLFLMSPVNNTLMGIPLSESCCSYLLTSSIFLFVGISLLEGSKIGRYISIGLISILILYSFKAASTFIAGFLILILEITEETCDKRTFILNIISVLNNMLYPMITIYLFKIYNYRVPIFKSQATDSSYRLVAARWSKNKNLGDSQDKHEGGYGGHRLIVFIIVISIICGLLNLYTGYITDKKVLEALILPHSYRSFLNFSIALLGILSYDLFHACDTHIPANK